jgi:hypothetical protein
MSLATQRLPPTMQKKSKAPKQGSCSNASNAGRLTMMQCRLHNTTNGRCQHRHKAAAHCALHPLILGLST